MKSLRLFAFLLFLLPLFASAQKKPLDHSVYDGWQSIGERAISNDGKWVVYTVTPQEGDARLYICSAENLSDSLCIPRGYNPRLSANSRFLVCLIRPRFADTRAARIRKKRPADMPKDSIAIVRLADKNVWKAPRVRSYKLPSKASGWLAYQKERDPAKRSGDGTQRTIDSLTRTVDSLNMLVTQLKNIKAGNRDGDADDDPSAAAAATEGSELVLRRLSDGSERKLANVVDYAFDTYGRTLAVHLGRKDTASRDAVLLYTLDKNAPDTILKGANDVRAFAYSEDGEQLAFTADCDTGRTLQKCYGLYLYKMGDDSAHRLIDKRSPGMRLGMDVSPNGTVSFSKSGRRLFFGTAPVQQPKDTTLVDFETAKLDIWNYHDDYLQSQQLFQLNNDLKRSWLAVYDLDSAKLTQLGSRDLPTVIQTGEGDGDVFAAVTDTGRRVAAQWNGNTIKDVYALNVRTGKRLLVKKGLDGSVYASPAGHYILMYDNKARNYFAWDGHTTRNITAPIHFPLYNEDNDVPDDPSPYGVMGWHNGDSLVYVYDKYDVWGVDPSGVRAPENMTFGNGRRGKKTMRFIQLDSEAHFFREGQELNFRTLDEKTKKGGWMRGPLHDFAFYDRHGNTGTYTYTGMVKARNADVYIFSLENYAHTDLYVARKWPRDNASGDSFFHERQLTALNPQQAGYNWGTAELYHWKAFNGKEATGILYKPEDFDPAKKYPVILYFYEKLSDGLYTYMPPAPTPSRLNIPFFVSRGYLVLAPDISYTRGHPGRDAYNYVVSGAQALARNKWVDGANMGIQGQSWGGYQVAYLVTATHLFKAAWAGAPVVNMFSAYGGIRWESGVNRQFQYEKGQSRIGATPWDRPDLYIENSPFFHLKNVTTPLVIMSNDADGAVPWYQGIEFFTAMRRLGKPVWLLSYNGEAHNLVERRNRKDIQIREQEYFDWQLKGAKPARWLTEGVPAVKKGRDWGLELVDE